MTSQEFIDGTPAPEDEIENFFAEFGFESIGDHSFRRSLSDTKITVRDARPDNVFKHHESGILIPIDIQILVQPF